MTQPDRIITADRCTAVLAHLYRPRLAAVETARIAGLPAPVADWRCVRTRHTMGPTDSHLAMPLGFTGRSVWFPADQEHPPAPDCDNPACQHPQRDHDTDGNCTLCPCAPPDDLPVDVYAVGPAPDPAPPTDVAALVEQLARAGTGVVRCEPGDTLLLIAPGDVTDVDGLTEMVANLVPAVAVVLLVGVTGAVVVPPPAPDPVHPFRGEPGELCRVMFGDRRCALAEVAVEHQYPPAPDRRYIPQPDPAVDPLTCRAGCTDTFTSAIARGRHEGPTGPHMMRRP